MPNRIEAAKRKPRQLATGRLQPLRLFSTPPGIVGCGDTSACSALSGFVTRSQIYNHFSAGVACAAGTVLERRLALDGRSAVRQD